MDCLPWTCERIAHLQLSMWNRAVASNYSMNGADGVALDPDERGLPGVHIADDANEPGTYVSARTEGEEVLLD